MTTPLWILAGGIVLTCLVMTVAVMAALVAAAREDRLVKRARDVDASGPMNEER